MRSVERVKRLLLVSIFSLGMTTACDSGSLNLVYYLVRERKSNEYTFLGRSGPLELYASCNVNRAGVPIEPEIYPGEAPLRTSLNGNVGSAVVIRRSPAASGGLGIGTGEIQPGIHHIEASLGSGRLDQSPSAKVEANFIC